MPIGLGGQGVQASKRSPTGCGGPPDAYRRVRGEWRRRERRRRLVLACLVVLVFTVADVAGLWALNQARNQPHIVFNDPTPVPRHP
ncbi:hypothetical protein [Microtetraspora niveoalba]|uniref:hypothetical protein n=1 Tax=Microtetraspora niveoalba TaxID=46175 RepID=UPI00082AE25A|nr:hypothetical protein [Microtetraspora niveoalba]